MNNTVLMCAHYAWVPAINVQHFYLLFFFKRQKKSKDKNTTRWVWSFIYLFKEFNFHTHWREPVFSHIRPPTSITYTQISKPFFFFLSIASPHFSLISPFLVLFPFLLIFLSILPFCFLHFLSLSPSLPHSLSRSPSHYLPHSLSLSKRFFFYFIDVWVLLKTRSLMVQVWQSVHIRG